MPDALAFIAKHWKLLLSGLALAILGFMLLHAQSQARHWHKLADANKQGWQLEMAKHAVTRQSLTQCIGSIDDMNAAVERLKTDADKRQADAGKALDGARKAAEGAQDRARALEASAAQSRSGGSCEASAAYQAARGDL
jgi:hypothetical protein